MGGIIHEVNTHMRDYDYEIVCGVSDKEYPEEFEIDRSNTGTLKDQGDVGACVAEVIVQLAEAFYGEEQSEGFTYCKFRNDSMIGSGMSVTCAMDMWIKIGTLPKKYFDILEEMPQLKKIVDKFPEFLDIAKKYRLKGYTSINYADMARRDLAYKDAIMSTGRGLVGISNNYFKESHAILLTGWNDKTGRYKFKNSWGKSFGDNGYGEIPKKEVNRIIVPHFEEIKLPFEDVKETDWFYNAVKNMYFSGLMNGTSNTTFEPNKPLTRAEMATILDRQTKLIDERFENLNKVFNEKIKR